MKKLFGLFVISCCFLISCKKANTDSPVAYHKFILIDGPQNFGSAVIFDCALDMAGNFWFGMENGIAKYDGNTWTTHQFFPVTSTADVLNRVKTVHVDKKGNIWAGVENNAYIYAFKFDGTGWINQYLSGTPVTSILEFSTGELWFCTQLTGIYKYDGSNWIFPACECGGSTTGIVDNNGVVYISETSTNNIDIYNGAGSLATIPVNTSGDGIYQMSPSSAGGILMVSSWGDWKYENSTWTNITPTDLPANTSSTSIFQDSKGRIWIGTAASGIFSVVDGKTTPYDAPLQVNKIFETKNGDIYACTNSGLYLYK